MVHGIWYVLLDCMSDILSQPHTENKKAQCSPLLFMLGFKYK